MKFHEKLKLLRVHHFLSQKEMAAKTGIKHSNFYSRYETGQVTPGLATLENICNQFPEYALWLITNSSSNKIRIIKNKEL